MSSSSRMPWYVSFTIVPSSLHINPGPWTVIQPQIISDPPPCLTVCDTVRGSWRLVSRTQHQERPSELKRLILVSSDQITRSQSAIVQCWCLFAKTNRSLIFFRESNGLVSFTDDLKQASLSARRTVLSETITFSS